VNLIESLGPTFLFDVLEGLEDVVDRVNCQTSLASRFSLDAIVSLVEEIYHKIQHYRQIQNEEKQGSETEEYSFDNLNEDLCMLITKALVGKKHTFLLTGSLDILAASLNPVISRRLLFLLLKKNINTGNDHLKAYNLEASIQTRDKVLNYAFNQVQQLYNELKT
jgi:hypothetical protein